VRGCHDSGAVGDELIVDDLIVDDLCRDMLCNGHAALCDRKYGNTTFLGSHDSFAVSTSVFARTLSQIFGSENLPSDDFSFKLRGRKRSTCLRS
jgi:hypothetical protein